MISLPCRKPELYSYSPHQSRMLLLDQVNSYDLESPALEAEVELSEDSEVYDKRAGGMPVWVSFEYMAQSIAALSGISRVETGGKPRIGFIVGVRDCRLEQPWFKPGETVTVRVSQEFREGDVAVFNGETLVDGELRCSAVLNVVENNKDIMESWTRK